MHSVLYFMSDFAQSCANYTVCVAQACLQMLNAAVPQAHPGQKPQHESPPCVAAQAVCVQGSQLAASTLLEQVAVEPCHIWPRFLSRADPRPGTWSLPGSWI